MYEEEALIHVICADVMCKSRPICAVITVPAPNRNEAIPIAIVAVNTKSTSWIVDLNALGRPLRFDCSSIGGVIASAEGSVPVVDGGVSNSAMLATLLAVMSVALGLLVFDVRGVYETEQLENEVISHF